MRCNNQEGEGLALGVAHGSAQKHEILWILWVTKRKQRNTKSILSQRIGSRKHMISRKCIALLCSEFDGSESLFVFAANSTSGQNSYDFPDRCGIVGDPQRDNYTSRTSSTEIFIIELQLQTLTARHDFDAPTVVGPGFDLLRLNCGNKAKKCAK
jgi:hypothetical protein